MAAALILALALQADAGVASSVDQGAEPQLADLRRAYEQSCLQRDYGSFDDVCNQLADQIAAFARAHPDRPAASLRPRAPPPPLVPSPPPAADAPPAAAADGANATR